ncbi:MAG: hypothetical protein GY863_06985 [bacterium]|nr:hypothetical protein [bacterium]
MKHRKFCSIILLMTIGFLSACSRQSAVSELSGPYLGQDPPGMTAELFAPGLLSTEVNEFNAAFTPSGDAVYFTVNSAKGGDVFVIERINGIWQERKPASFSGTYNEVDPFVTHDGRKLFFSSNRPVAGGEAQKDCDFWFVEKLPSGNWGEAKHLDNPSTQDMHDYYYVSTRSGTIYYSIMDFNDNGDLFYIDKDNTAKKLDFPINTDYNEHDPFIAPDESFLIFTSNRPGGYGSADLYICFRQSDGTWSDPVNMGANVNSNGYDYCAILSPDEKYLFFSSSRTGNGDVYWVDAKIIEELKPEDIK